MSLISCVGVLCLQLLQSQIRTARTRSLRFFCPSSSVHPHTFVVVSCLVCRIDRDCLRWELSRNGQVHVRFVSSGGSGVGPTAGTEMASSLQHDDEEACLQTEDEQRPWILTCSSLVPSESILTSTATSTATSVTPVSTQTVSTFSTSLNVRSSPPPALLPKLGPKRTGIDPS